MSEWQTILTFFFKNYAGIVKMTAKQGRLFFGTECDQGVCKQLTF